MRASLVLGACVGGVLATQVASAQFAADRTPPAFGGAAPPAAQPNASSAVPQLPGGIQPVGFTAPASGTADNKRLPNGFMLPDPRRKETLTPVASTTNEAAGPHPWAVKAEHGPWMILVRSYSGAESRKLAEKLAADIRQTHNVAAYLFARNGEERRVEQDRVKAIRKQEEERVKPIRDVMTQARKQAVESGSQFVDEPIMLKIPRPYHEAPEEWAVLIGGFESMEAAHKLLGTVKKLPAPKDTSLCDTAMIGGEEKNTRTNAADWKSAVNYLNPYAGAMTVPNPAGAKARLEEKDKLEPFVVKLNQGVENSLLTAKKPWTLLVKVYTSPIRMEGRDGGGGSVFGRKIQTGASSEEILRATAAEATLLAKALRHPSHKPRSFEAFILHHRTGTFVTVGQFDSSTDADLLRTVEELRNLTYTPLDKDQKPELGSDGRPKVLRMFDGMTPMQVPKY